MQNHSIAMLPATTPQSILFLLSFAATATATTTSSATNTPPSKWSPPEPMEPRWTPTQSQARTATPNTFGDARGLAHLRLAPFPFILPTESPTESPANSPPEAIDSGRTRPQQRPQQRGNDEGESVEKKKQAQQAPQAQQQSPEKKDDSNSRSKSRPKSKAKPKAKTAPEESVTVWELLPKPKPNHEQEAPPARMAKPMNAFLLFCADHRPSLRKSDPFANNNDTSRSLGMMWRKLPDSEKTRYHLLSRELRSKHWVDSGLNFPPAPQRVSQSQ